MAIGVNPTAGPPQSMVDGRGYACVSDWIADNPGWETRFYEYGYMLFRGFPITDVAAFEGALGSLMRPMAEFAEETSPRSRLSDRVFTSTDYPPQYPIQLHHEFSYRRDYPHRLVFCCIRPADAGGATPLADSRKVLSRIPADLASRFESQGVRYLRNFSELGIAWQDAFGESSKEKVAGYCLANDIEYSWSGEQLQTRQVASAVTIHPVTGERTWFNSILNLNVAGVEPETVRQALQALPESMFPTNTAYASGDPIEPEVIDFLRRVYLEETVRFTWQTGDLLLIDNVLTAHGRDPFEGHRRVVTAMGYAW